MNDALRLSSDEYLHLALHASGRGDAHAALQYLHAVLQAQPEHALAHYLLAAEHAGLGLYARARDGFQHALTLQPAMDTARFQLGLLQAQLGDVPAARDEFSRLAAASSDAALRDFSLGLLQLLDGMPDAARPLLQAGVEHCNNAPLKADMQRVLVNLGASSPQAAPETRFTDDTRSRTPVFLGAYRQAGQDPS